MTNHFLRELRKIKRMLLTVGAMVEERVHQAVLSIVNLDPHSAKVLIASDEEVDEMDVMIEEECLKILALYQPVATDLRFLVATIKINRQLERIADECVSIGHRIIAVETEKQIPLDIDILMISRKVETMLKKSLDAFANLDPEPAFYVCFEENELDYINMRQIDPFFQKSCNGEGCETYWINMFLICQRLNRIANHSGNIAEEVIYMTEGRIVRHSFPQHAYHEHQDYRICAASDI